MVQHKQSQSIVHLLDVVVFLQRGHVDALQRRPVLRTANQAYGGCNGDIRGERRVQVTRLNRMRIGADEFEEHLQGERAFFEDRLGGRHLLQEEAMGLPAFVDEINMSPGMLLAIGYGLVQADAVNAGTCLDHLDGVDSHARHVQSAGQHVRVQMWVCHKSALRRRVDPREEKRLPEEEALEQFLKRCREGGVGLARRLLRREVVKERRCELPDKADGGGHDAGRGEGRVAHRLQMRLQREGHGLQEGAEAAVGDFAVGDVEELIDGV